MVPGFSWISAPIVGMIGDWTASIRVGFRNELLPFHLPLQAPGHEPEDQHADHEHRPQRRLARGHSENLHGWRWWRRGGDRTHVGKRELALRAAFVARYEARHRDRGGARLAVTER